jgi:hypothetical protein
MLQPVMRHQGGVLSELQDGWMLRPVLTGWSQSHNSGLAVARSASTVTSARSVPRSRTFSSEQAITQGRLTTGTGHGDAQEVQQRPVPHALPPRILDGLVSRVTPVMTIMDLEISSDIAQRAQLGTLGWDMSALLDLDHLNAAFGYISQVMVFLSVVLDVPLLYHINLQGSHCSIRQAMPTTSHSLQRALLEVCSVPCLTVTCIIRYWFSCSCCTA